MKKEVIVIIAVCVVVAIITAFVTTNITGNVVSVGWWNKHQVYTVDEVDKLIEDLNNGDTPVYYTKTEIDNLLKSLASGETVVISKNDTYTKTQIDYLINSINKTTIQQTEIDAKEVLEIVNKYKTNYDFFTIRGPSGGSEYFPFPNNCNEVCADTSGWGVDKPMICIGAVGVYWRDIPNTENFYTHYFACDTPKSTYINGAISDSDDIYAQCMCAPY
tara:strand:- start:438 stop:1091 length:654 start_codon:yes stop_codon:yes gene_type:complete